MQTENLLLDSTLGNKMIYSHILLLSDTVGAVCGLLFYGRVPPRIQMDDIVSACQVQPQTTSLETDKENRTGSMLKVIDHHLSLLYRCTSVQIEMFNS